MSKEQRIETNRGVIAAAIIILILTGSSFLRNAVYRDPVRLWEDTAAKSPAKMRAQENLASAYAAQNRFDTAIETYSNAISAQPNASITYYNRGLAYSRQGKFEKAVEDYS